MKLKTIIIWNAIWFLIALGYLLFICGCQRGDIRITPVIAGQVAPHDGWNISPDMYLLEGDIVPMTGLDFWMNGLDPNDLF